LQEFLVRSQSQLRVYEHECTSHLLFTITNGDQCNTGKLTDVSA